MLPCLIAAEFPIMRAITYQFRMATDQP